MLKLKKKRGAKKITLRWLIYPSTYTIVTRNKHDETKICSKSS